MTTIAASNLSTASVDALVSVLRGSLVQPGDDEYDEARAVYNAMIDRRPAAIVRCRDVADVVACVKFAQENSLPLAIRGGGHNAAGLGTWDDAVVVDLSPMHSVTVDPVEGTVRVDGGCTWADVDHATVPFGLAVPCGFLGSTGVGGLTLGGGMGYLTRRYGMTVDNLLGADVVLADGTLVRADAEQHPDLFWALRGGGGNFGVVTSFTFRGNPVGDQGVIYGGPVLYDLADTGAVMRWYRELLPKLPEELNGWIGTMTIPGAAPFPEELWGRKACGIVWCYTGSLARAEEVTAPVREFGSPLVVGMHEMPFNVLQGAFDGLYPAGLQWYWKADFCEEISDEAIAIHEKYAALLPTGHSTMHLYPVGGAAQRVRPQDTAFVHRNGGWSSVIVGVDPDPANVELISTWARDYWEELHPTTSMAPYINMIMQEGQERIEAAYGDNYERLARIKQTYDPGNFFHVNQNIAPALPRQRSD